MKYDKIVQYLLEAFQNYQYELPKDKEQMLFDFYLGSMLPRYKFEDPKHYPQLEDPKIAFLIKDIQEKLCEEIKKELLYSVFYAVCCEMRYLFYIPAPGHWDYPSEVPYTTTLKNTNILKNPRYQKMFKLLSQEIYPKNTEADDYEEADTYAETFQKTKKILKACNVSDKEYMILAKTVFNIDSYWGDVVEGEEVSEVEYGGKSWANIADGWLQLNNATSLGDQIVWIDHVWDLQHNGGTIFDKLSSYYKAFNDVPNSLNWLNAALEYKKHISKLQYLFHKASPPLASFAKYVLRRAGENTSNDAEYKNPAIVFKPQIDNLIYNLNILTDTTEFMKHKNAIQSRGISPESFKYMSNIKKASKNVDDIIQLLRKVVNINILPSSQDIKITTPREMRVNISYIFYQLSFDNNLFYLQLTPEDLTYIKKTIITRLQSANLLNNIPH